MAKKSVTIAETLTDKEYAPLRQQMKDEGLCEEIVNLLGEDVPQIVLLTGEAGIGKTRLAKKVGEYAIKQRVCFMTLCLHLNKKFKAEDELSLYENIASQLSVYSDFEESEVDDRDEDEEEDKNVKALLDEMKKKITEEINKKDMAALKAEQEAQRKAEENADKNTSEKNVKNQSADKKEKPTVVEKMPAEAEKNDKASTRASYLLLILDDEGNKTSAKEVMKNLKLEEFLRKQDFLKDSYKRLKIIVTKRTGVEETTKPGGEMESQDTNSEPGIEKQEEAKSDEGIQSDGEAKSQDKDNEEKTEPQATTEAQVKKYDEIEFHITDKSQALLKSIDNQDLFLSLTWEDWTSDKKLVDDMMEKSKNLPAAITVLAKSLKQISISNPEEEEKITKLIKKVLSADRPEPSDPGSSSESTINPILHLAYVLLETYGPWKDVIVDCLWHSLDFFEHCGCVYYRDLITQWILEGYFDPVRSVEKAYQDGHSILMELINRGMLKIQENNVVVPEMAMSNLLDPRRRGHLGRSRLGFSRVYAGDKEQGIGKITQIDDMIKTVQAKKGDKITTILVSGDRLRRATLEKYFKKLGGLEVLGLFEPTLDPFVTSFSNLVALRVLVIRDCDLLEGIKELKDLTKLHALEVSGASSLKEIPDEFFTKLSKLQSLHLSGLQITSSPSSISKLNELHCLIIRDCPLLEDLPEIQELKKLEIVDISGARGLQTCFDNTKGEKKSRSKNKNFYHLTKLQLLDFSESKIERLPIFQDSAEAKKLHSLTRLLLRNCIKLRRLPSLKPLSGLQILDLSGTTSLVEMLEVCFEDKKELKTLNLSRSNLSELATTIEELSNLKELLLKDCTNLEVIPNIQKLTNLEVIDVSGCTKLHTIEGSFEDMSYLCEVNLSGTKVKTPVLPNKSLIVCLKYIILADGRRFEGEDWNKIRESMPSETSDDTSSSNAAVKPQEIQSNEPCSSDSTKKEDVIGERLLQVPTDKAPYKKILSLFDSESQQQVMEIHETNDLGGEALAKAEFVSFVDISSTRLKSILDETKSVKGCSLRMCMDIKDLFPKVKKESSETSPITKPPPSESSQPQKTLMITKTPVSGSSVPPEITPIITIPFSESLGSLETLSITNLPLLETISCGDSLKNLKKLTIDCCPNIKTLFPEASHLPSSLDELHIKRCEKLEKIVEGVELSTLINLTWKVENCPNFKGNPQGSDWVMVDRIEASPQD